MEKIDNLYLESGYLNPAIALDCPEPFVVIFGGRGTGKTYGILRELVERGITFGLMRRLQTQLYTVCTPQMNVFKAINEDEGWNIIPVPINHTSYAFYRGDADNKPQGAPVGYAMALSTIVNMRGFGAEDIKVVVYDEFIPEAHEKSMRNEYEAIMNAYSTINRNRELKGQPPLKLVMLANANNIVNPFFVGAKLVEKVESMKRTGRTVLRLPHRGIVIVSLDNSPISKRQENTALYKFTKKTGFSDMAFANQFSANDNSYIANRPLVEYQPYIRVGEISILHHKSRDEFYVTLKNIQCKIVYGTTDNDRRRFAAGYPKLWIYYLRGLLRFNSFEAERYFKDCYKVG